VGKNLPATWSRARGHMGCTDMLTINWWASRSQPSLTRGPESSQPAKGPPSWASPLACWQRDSWNCLKQDSQARPLGLPFQKLVGASGKITVRAVVSKACCFPRPCCHYNGTGAQSWAVANIQQPTAWLSLP
jgi:hypothetical protein